MALIKVQKTALETFKNKLSRRLLMAKQENPPKARILLIEDNDLFRRSHKFNLDKIAGGADRVHAVIDATTATAIWGLNGGYEAVIVNGSLEGDCGLRLVENLSRYHGKPSRVYVISSKSHTLEEARKMGFHAFGKTKLNDFYKDLEEYFGIKKPPLPHQRNI